MRLPDTRRPTHVFQSLLSQGISLLALVPARVRDFC